MNLTTKEKLRAKQLFDKRVLKHMNGLLNSQLALAQGLNYLYRVDTVVENGKEVKTHELVTDPNEIKDYLDGNDGGEYYYMTTKDPDLKAIDSLLDRTFGKANQSLGDGKGGGSPVKILIINDYGEPSE